MIIIKKPLFLFQTPPPDKGSPEYPFIERPSVVRNIDRKESASKADELLKKAHEPRKEEFTRDLFMEPKELREKQDLWNKMDSIHSDLCQIPDPDNKIQLLIEDLSVEMKKIRQQIRDSETAEIKYKETLRKLMPVSGENIERNPDGTIVSGTVRDVPNDMLAWPVRTTKGEAGPYRIYGTIKNGGLENGTLVFPDFSPTQEAQYEVKDFQVVNVDNPVLRDKKPQTPPKTPESTPPWW